MIFCYYNLFRTACVQQQRIANGGNRFLDKAKTHFMNEIILRMEKNKYRGNPNGKENKNLVLLFEDLSNCTEFDKFEDLLKKYMTIWDKVKPHADVVIIKPKQSYRGDKHKVPNHLLSNIYVKDHVALTPEQQQDYGCMPILHTEGGITVRFVYTVPDSAMKLSESLHSKRPFYIGAYGKAHHLRFGNRYFILSPSAIFNYNFNEQLIHQINWYGIDFEEINELCLAAREMIGIDNEHGIRNF